jgi:4-amino-4-deoxy-L-arabinose transferase-like glycosyltransferase
MEKSRPASGLWPVLAVTTMIVILVAAVRWSLSHPYGIHWDEASYINEAWVDAQRLRYGRLLTLGGRILLKSWGRPPAYRLLADPFLAVFGLHVTMARLVSLACFALSTWFVYSAARQIGTKTAGGFAALVFCLSPEVVSASIFFGTDAPLYLAVSAMLYYLFAGWGDQAVSAANWIGLGLAIGLGLLSKTSFVLIVFPALLFWFFIGRRRNLNGPSAVSLWKAGVLGLCIAAPWWLINIRSAFAYAQYSRAFVRNSLGPSSSPETWVRWFNTVLQCLLGPGISILIALVLAACFVKIIIRKETILSGLQTAALGTCACAGIPIVLAQLTGTNPLLRHITPSVIPLAIAVGVLADTTGWAHAWAGVAISCILFCAQLLMLVVPVAAPNTRPLDIGFANGALPWRTMIRFDQWDWSPVRRISDSCDLASPKIAYIGGGREFDPPAIQYPWVAAATSTPVRTFPVPNVTWLWRSEDGGIDWQKVMDGADKSDVVLTAPHYIGEVKIGEDLDNQYNAEFADRLSQDPLFRPPIHIKMGRFEPVDVVAFVKKNSVCH